MVKIVLFLSFALLLGSCSESNETEKVANVERQHTAVTLTHISYNSIKSETVFTATTAYLNKATVTSPMAAYVKQSFAVQGMRVKAGQTLYVLENKDQHFIGNAPTIDVKAMQSGVVIDNPVQAGNYVTDAATLCTVAVTGSMVFEINVPTEQQAIARTGCDCTIELPDGTRLKATVSQPLATMNTVSQSSCVVARANSPFLPEGMNAKAIFSTMGKKGMTLPRSAVQSDETMTKHWVMKLRNDSTTQKVAVTIGNSDTERIEITSGILSFDDRIILTGGYGLEDGAIVRIEKR